MEQIVLDEAKTLGFPYQLNSENRWQILPPQPEATWKLTLEESRWVLSLHDVPQLRLDLKQAIAFLTSRAKAVRSNVQSD